MEHLIRRAKSGRAWTANELLAYNIQVHSQSAETFFGHPLPTLDGIDPLLVSGTINTDGTTDRTDRLLQYLHLTLEADADQSFAIDDFAEELLRQLDYQERGTLLRYHYAIPLAICGDTRRLAQTGVCLAHQNTMILLIIQEDIPAISRRAPEAQVIAEAIAAFQHNNSVRDRLGEPLLASMTVPCITMVGTRPTFYKVPVTQELSQGVITAQYPTQTTVVTKCIVSSPSGRHGSTRFPRGGLAAFHRFPYSRQVFLVCIFVMVRGYK